MDRVSSAPGRPAPGRLAALAALLLALSLPSTACSQDAPEQRASGAAADTADVYRQTPPSRGGIGKVYMGREISQVMGHLGSDWLERPERAANERPGLLVDSMALAADAAVADIGAGTGYFTFRLARAAPDGRVFAVDIQPEMLSIMRDSLRQNGLDNVSLVKGTAKDPRLPADSLDAALMVDAYHEFAYPREMMTALVDALKPGGRIYLIEYRKEDPGIPIKRLHKMTETQARKEMEAVGLEWVRTGDFLPRQHFLVFEKPTEE
jgi:precorrin-6B methylase 2